MEKEIMKSKNRALLYSLIEEIKQHPFKIVVRAYYNNGLSLQGFVIEKNWVEVYNLE